MKKQVAKKPAAKKTTPKKRGAIHYTKKNGWHLLPSVGTVVVSEDAPTGIWCADDCLKIPSYKCGLDRYMKDIGKLPLPVYRQLPDGSRVRARELPIFNIVDKQPNNSMSRNQLHELIVYRMIHCTEYFGQLIRDGQGNILQHVPIENCQVQRVWRDDQFNKYFDIQLSSGTVETFADTEIIHLWFFSKDGLRGSRLVDMCDTSLGLHKQIMETGTAIFHNTSRQKGYWRTPQSISAELSASLREALAPGPHNAGKAPFLSNDFEWKPFNDSTVADAQIVEAIQASAADVGRWLNLSPIALNDYSAAHYNSLQADNTHVYQRSIAPILAMIEAEYNRKFFGVNSDLYCEFTIEALLQGDIETQSNVYKTGVDAGYYEPNEVREFMNMPPISEDTVEDTNPVEDNG